jgi:hypothetical protein
MRARASGDFLFAPDYWPHRLAGRAAWAVARRRSRRGLAPSPCGAGGMAPPLPLRRRGQAADAPMASVRQWPHRRVWVSCCECNHLDGHACEHPQRARDPWPEASTSAKAGSCGFEYSRVPPGRAVVVEAERSRVERGRPRDRGPARSGGCGRTSRCPARLLAPSPCGAGGMAPPLPLRRGGQARVAPMASVRQWPHRRVVCGLPCDFHRTSTDACMSRVSSGCLSTGFPPRKHIVKQCTFDCAMSRKFRGLRSIPHEPRAYSASVWTVSGALLAPQIVWDHESICCASRSAEPFRGFGARLPGMEPAGAGLEPRA